MKIISCYWQIWGWTPCPTLRQARPSCQLRLAPAFLWTLISHLAPHCAPGPLHLPNILCVRHAPFFHFLLILLEPWGHLSWLSYLNPQNDRGCIYVICLMGSMKYTNIYWMVKRKFNVNPEAFSLLPVCPCTIDSSQQPGRQAEEATPPSIQPFLPRAGQQLPLQPCLPGPPLLPLRPSSVIMAS